MRIKIHIFLFVSFFSFLVRSQDNPLQTADSVAQLEWVEKTYQQMDLKEKIGQLFMVLVASDQSKSATDRIRTLIEEEHLGECDHGCAICPHEHE